MAFRHFKSPIWLVIADSNPGELQLCEPNNCLQKVVASSALRPARAGTRAVPYVAWCFVKKCSLPCHILLNLFKTSKQAQLPWQDKKPSCIECLLCVTFSKSAKYIQSNSGYLNFPKLYSEQMGLPSKPASRASSLYLCTAFCSASSSLLYQARVNFLLHPATPALCTYFGF